jgi:ATP-dependent Clp protease ATP-binding subunit ClpC
MDHEKTYTAKADRVLFFARYEATCRENDEVEPEHILLGLVRADPELFRRLSGASPEVADDILAALKGTAVKPKSNTFGELPPLSASGKKILDSAVAHSQRLNHEYIGTEHILLSLLAEGSQTTRILHELGFTVEEIIPKIIGGNITDQDQQPRDRAVLSGRIVRND